MISLFLTKMWITQTVLQIMVFVAGKWWSFWHIMQDADQLLEKRVRSRFSHRKLLFLPPSKEDIQRYVLLSKTRGLLWLHTYIPKLIVCSKSASIWFSSVLIMQIAGANFIIANGLRPSPRLCYWIQYKASGNLFFYYTIRYPF